MGKKVPLLLYKGEAFKSSLRVVLSLSASVISCLGFSVSKKEPIFSPPPTPPFSGPKEMSRLSSTSSNEYIYLFTCYAFVRVAFYVLVYNE